MAAKTLTYLDIPLDIRRESAARARTNLRALLANPAYTLEQRGEILSQIERVSRWEAGQLPIEGIQPPQEAPAPTTGFGRIKPS